MSDEPHKPITFFFDGTHGKLIPELLKSAGLSIRLHRNQGWLDDMLDVDWIAECGKNGWAIISGDKAISRVPEERQAVTNAKCKVFMFDDSHETRTADWAASLLVARHRLIEIAEGTNGPLFVLVKKCNVYGHIKGPDFVAEAGGGWKPIEERAADVPSQQEKSLEKPAKCQQQGVIDFSTEIPIVEQSAVDYHEEIMLDIETRELLRAWWNELTKGINQQVSKPGKT